MTGRGKRPGLTSNSFAAEQDAVNGRRNDFAESALNCAFRASYRTVDAVKLGKMPSILAGGSWRLD